MKRPWLLGVGILLGWSASIGACSSGSDETSPDGSADGGFDSTLPDSSFPDSSLPDSSFPDSSFPDSSSPDSGNPDASSDGGTGEDADASDANSDGATTVRATGRVLGSLFRAPRVGADVVVKDADGHTWTTKTDANGAYAFDAVVPPYDIRVTTTQNAAVSVTATLGIVAATQEILITDPAPTPRSTWISFSLPSAVCTPSCTDVNVGIRSTNDAVTGIALRKLTGSDGDGGVGNGFTVKYEWSGPTDTDQVSIVAYLAKAGGGFTFAQAQANVTANVDASVGELAVTDVGQGTVTTSVGGDAGIAGQTTMYFVPGGIRRFLMTLGTTTSSASFTYPTAPGATLSAQWRSAGADAGGTADLVLLQEEGYPSGTASIELTPRAAPLLVPTNGATMSIASDEIVLTNDDSGRLLTLTFDPQADAGAGKDINVNVPAGTRRITLARIADGVGGIEPGSYRLIARQRIDARTPTGASARGTFLSETARRTITLAP